MKRDDVTGYYSSPLAVLSGMRHRATEAAVPTGLPQAELEARVWRTFLIWKLVLETLVGR